MKEIWNRTQKQLRDSLMKNKIIWLDQARYESSTGDTLTLSFKSTFYSQMFVKQLLTEAQNTLSELAGHSVKILTCVKTRDEAHEEPQVEKKDEDKPQSVPEAQKIEIKTDFAESDRANPTLNPKYTFDNFIVGENCRFAYNVAKVIAENPGTSLNPCLIYGGVGLGKTHLIQAIGNYISGRSRLNVIYVTAETFTNELIKCFIKSSQDATSKFKNKYRNADVLLIDDIHFISNKDMVQEEFFNTFNDLTERNRQIVFTCDRPISELTGVKERLITRFRKGVNVDLQPPVYEERMAIAEQKCKALGFNIREDVKEFLCMNIKSNVRDLEGALTTLASFEKLVGKEVTVKIAEEHIKNFLPPQMIKNSDITIDRIIHETASYFNVSSYEVTGKGRSKSLVSCRHISMYLSSVLTNLTLSEIGKFFDGKDHTTVSYAVNKIQTAISKNDESITEPIKTITSILKNQ